MTEGDQGGTNKPNELNRTKVDRSGPNRTIVDRIRLNGLNKDQSVPNGPHRTKVDLNKTNWTAMD